MVTKSQVTPCSKVYKKDKVKHHVLNLLPPSEELIK